MDYVRSTHYLRIIEEEKLVENARIRGELFLAELEALARKHPVISAVRGRGLMLAFDLPDTAMRDSFWKGSYELGLLVVRCGERSIRLRPVLVVSEEIIEKSVLIMEKEARRL
jgi:L-lysine 6-transaminase